MNKSDIKIKLSDFRPINGIVDYEIRNGSNSIKHRFAVDIRDALLLTYNIAVLIYLPLAVAVSGAIIATNGLEKLISN